MPPISAVSHARPIHPLHAMLLAFPLPLFLGGLLSDLAYTSNFHVQWINFAQWLIAGALLVGAFAWVWSLVGFIKSRPADRRRHGLYMVTLLIMWVLGFINALVHAKDAWASMPEGVYLSLITTLLAMIAAWVGYSGLPAAEVRK